MQHRNTLYNCENGIKMNSSVTLQQELLNHKCKQMLEFLCSNTLPK